MKNLILCLVLSTLSLSSFAGSDGKNYHLDQMSKKLQLTETQQAQVKAVFDKNASQREALRESMRNLRQSTDKEIREALTPEQQQTFDQMKQKRKAKHHHKKSKKGHGKQCD